VWLANCYFAHDSLGFPACYDSVMRDLVVLFIHFIATLARLGVYIAYEALSDMTRRAAPEHSAPGIVLACVSLVVMPILSRAKKKVGKALGTAAMNADALQTDFCVYLSAILLVGLVLNAVLGWWWADPVAALTMVPIIVKEGIDGLKERTCC
jgi:divalent metal cation (Fe/Co/Zn/Cd) transporter